MKKKMEAKEISKKKVFVNKYIKPWFFSSDNPDKIKPIRCAITIFIILIVSSVIIKLSDPKWLSDTIVLGLMGNLGLLLGADVWKSNNDKKFTNPENITNK